MQYLGGKISQGRKLGPFFTSVIEALGGPNYYEPFVGAAGVMSRVHTTGRRYGGDINQDLIVLWKALQDGWVPPEDLTREEWLALKADPECSPLKSFAGFGCSMMGRWFSTYKISKTGVNLRGQAARSLVKLNQLCCDVEWRNCDYKEWEFEPGAVVYCDPPYEGSTPKWRDSFGFKYKEFWPWALHQFHDNNVRLYTSYFTVPDGWKPVVDLTQSVMAINVYDKKLHQAEFLLRPKRRGE